MNRIYMLAKSFDEPQFLTLASLFSLSLMLARPLFACLVDGALYLLSPSSLDV